MRGRDGRHRTTMAIPGKGIRLRRLMRYSILGKKGDNHDAKRHRYSSTPCNHLHRAVGNRHEIGIHPQTGVRRKPRTRGESSLQFAMSASGTRRVTPDSHRGLPPPTEPKRPNADPHSLERVRRPPEIMRLRRDSRVKSASPDDLDQCPAHRLGPQILAQVAVQFGHAEVP